MKAAIVGFQIALLYGFYLLGVWISESLNLFIPGSVVGMVLLFLVLCSGLLKSKWVKAGSAFMLAFLPLFFIPVTVGVIQFPTLFSVKGVLLIAAIGLSTCMAFSITGWISERLVSKKESASHVVD